MALPITTLEERHENLKASAVALALSGHLGLAQHAGQHQAVGAADLKWSDVPSLPKGAQIAVIEGR
jgi:hypothetical protein